jgi:hypothetical protein
MAVPGKSISAPSIAQMARALAAQKARMASGIPAAPSAGSLRATNIAELAQALRESKRAMTQYGAKWDVPDPHAQDILNHPKSRDILAGISSHLGGAGVKDVRPLSGGFESVVLDAGDRVVKLGMGSPRTLPEGVQGVLPYQSTAKIGPFRVELQRKADVSLPTGRDRASPQDVENLEGLLGYQGWDWGDAAPDNMGFLDGQPVAIDGTIKAAGGSVDWPIRRGVWWPKDFHPGVGIAPTEAAVDEAVGMRRLFDSLVTPARK